MSEKLHERFVDLGMHRHHCRRTRQPVNGGKLTDNGARTEKLKDALSARTRNHRNLEESDFNTIAAVAGSARPEQDLTRGEPYPVRVSKQFRGKFRGQF